MIWRSIQSQRNIPGCRNRRIPQLLWRPFFYSECVYRRCNSKRNSVHKNLPFVVADHFTRLCKQTFPDSKITKTFSCGRTKTTMIVKHAIAPTLEEQLVKQCKILLFSFGCDECNDTNRQKALAIVVKYFDEVRERAVTGFLDMPICNIGTAQSIFDQLDATYEVNGIPRKNVVAFISYNCNTMVGKKNSVVIKSRRKTLQFHWYYYSKYASAKVALTRSWLA